MDWEVSGTCLYQTCIFFKKSEYNLGPLKKITHHFHGWMRPECADCVHAELSDTESADLLHVGGSDISPTCYILRKSTKHVISLGVFKLFHSSVF